MVLASLGVLSSPVSRASDSAVLTVTTAPARTGVRPEYISAFGLVKPWDEVKVDARIAGIPVIYAPLRVGDAVRKGQLLASFSSARTRIQLSMARASYAEAEARYVDAKLKQQRATLLHSKGMLSAQSILDIDTQTTIAQARLAAARARVSDAELQLAHTRVTAPVSGVISSRTVKLGEIPNRGTELYRIIRRDRLQWEPELTASQLSTVRTGMKTQVALADGHDVNGTVQRVTPVMNPGTQTGFAYIALESSPLLRAGMYANGRIVLGKHSVILVPSQSVVTRGGRSYAVTYRKGHAIFVPVTVGPRGAHFTQIFGGLPAGSRMILQGAGLLSNGASVSLAVDSK